LSGSGWNACSMSSSSSMHRSAAKHVTGKARQASLRNNSLHRKAACLVPRPIGRLGFRRSAQGRSG
jgi:hypothetical protein